MRGWKSFLQGQQYNAPTGVCAECGEETSCRVEDESFDHAFGVEHCWGYGGSLCCDATVLDGYVVNEGVHTARRDHQDGWVKKGDRYSCTCIIYVEDGQRKFMMSKSIIKRFVAPNPHA